MVAGEPFYRDLFRFSGRRRRGSYFNFVLTTGVLLFPLYVLMDHGAGVPGLTLLLSVLMIPIGIASLAVTAQRCRDIDWSGWAALLNVVPVIGMAFCIMLLFYPGTRGPNRYGPDPRDAQPST